MNRISQYSTCTFWIHYFSLFQLILLKCIWLRGPQSIASHGPQVGKPCFKPFTNYIKYLKNTLIKSNYNPIRLAIVIRKSYFWVVLIMSDKNNAENCSERALKNFQFSIFFCNIEFQSSCDFSVYFQRQDLYFENYDLSSKKLLLCGV